MKLTLLILLIFVLLCYSELASAYYSYEPAHTHIRLQPKPKDSRKGKQPRGVIVPAKPYKLTDRDLKIVEDCFYASPMEKNDPKKSCRAIVYGGERKWKGEERLYAKQQEYRRVAIREHDILPTIRRCYDGKQFGESKECNDLLATIMLGQNVIPNRVPSAKEVALYNYFGWFVNLMKLMNEGKEPNKQRKKSSMQSKDNHGVIFSAIFK